MLGGAVQLCTAWQSSELIGPVIPVAFWFPLIREDALLHFPSDAAANKAAEETAQTVGSAAIDYLTAGIHIEKLCKKGVIAQCVL